MRTYLFVIFMGIPAIFLYNFFASFLRSVGNSVVQLVFLAVSAVVNVVLDLWFVIELKRGVGGAAEATVIAQYLSGIGIAAYALLRCPQVHSIRRLRSLRWARIGEILSFSTLTCVQQSVMNLGILTVQGLVNQLRHGGHGLLSGPIRPGLPLCPTSYDDFRGSRGRRRSFRRACGICALRALSTAASAACSCSTGCTGRWKSRG